jgi:hypothetical protein
MHASGFRCDPTGHADKDHPREGGRVSRGGSGGAGYDNPSIARRRMKHSRPAFRSENQSGQKHLDHEQMRAIKFLLLLATLLAAATDSLSSTAIAREPGVIAVGEARDQIKQTPIEKRPYRPLHIYGNAVRRRQSRGGSSAQR